MATTCAIIEPMQHYVTKNRPLRIAVLDMNDGYKNQGIRCISEILAESIGSWNTSHERKTPAMVEYFRVRDKGEVPEHTFDIYVSSGGPGSPFDGEGEKWEHDFFNLLDSVIEHNLHRERKTYFFAICHSLQILSRKLRLAEVVPAPRPVYGIMPVYPTPDGMQSYLLEDFADRFFAFERRNYQVVDPDESALAAVGGQVLAIESRNGLRGKAIMALSIGNEFQATQFHPEADRDSVLRNFLDPEKRGDILELNGEELYNKMLNSLRSEDRVKRTRALVLPKFLARAYQHLLQEN
jgi:GMP synthase-like glutamine amidotransferase